MELKSAASKNPRCICLLVRGCLTEIDLLDADDLLDKSDGAIEEETEEVSSLFFWADRVTRRPDSNFVSSSESVVDVPELTCYKTTKC